ncbi:hypothetical protein [Hoeflea sp.]|uniref:hypothetical protein n=1 Tax=Hoeflea sp. TaxID=1940281 RepID=UPI00374946D8
MFGIELITRRATVWNSDRKHRALSNMISQLPDHVQKDIGWPAYDASRTAARLQSEIRARPIL